MIIRVSKISGQFSAYLIPVYLYDEQCSIFVSILELIFYLLCGYVAFSNHRTFLRIRMFHQNFIILAIPMFGLWYEVIIGKLITMAYQLEFLKVSRVKMNNFYDLWTSDPEEMVTVDSLDVIYGAIAHCIERTIASLLINNYETNEKLYIPIALTFFTQFLAIFTSYVVLFDKIDIIYLIFLWMGTCVISLVLFFWLKHTNEKWLCEMKSPHRKRTFTVSQRFQVKENIRALKLGKRLVFAVLGTMIISGSGIILVILELIPQFLCHFVENAVLLNPLWICPVFMYSLPAWRDDFRRAFPSFLKKKQKLGTVDVDVKGVDVKKRISMETDVHFIQLNEFWT
ncbi:Protein CBG20957 [Caenorhabditis briggsae]|uniref:Protein CBG20957 n=1 Tax=Caenorhabditis briggsae TaxID=6238 RepID=A8XZ16_CAEBR|nr:Protein CBG20957 [Caenorhabditis briggsae]CAP37883.1 Protein CBG20957 [Caenorhabditis briggsae]